ncbi:MAG: NAD-dependent protein deacylase [Epulopiscium sp.]|nr:NAD-dependent protein deacylase [Candidatus Epulonipiscium sp.]
MSVFDSSFIKEQILKSHYPIALTGAGISVASSLPTLSKEFCGIPIKKIMEKSFFLRHPELFYSFYREILRWKDCIPNAAHVTLSKYGVLVITQNIDGLHQKAGSRNVLEIHGNLNYLICEKCSLYFPFDLAYYSMLPVCHSCSSILKPDIVLYEEQIHYWNRAVLEFKKADLALIIGTSLKAFPANMLPQFSIRHNIKPILINENAHIILDF